MKGCAQEPTHHVQLSSQGAEEGEIRVLSYKADLEVQMASLGTVRVCPARLSRSQCPGGTAGQRRMKGQAGLEGRQTLNHWPSSEDLRAALCQCLSQIPPSASPVGSHVTHQRRDLGIAQSVTCLTCKYDSLSSNP